jgi:hypothetical protein
VFKDNVPYQTSKSFKELMALNTAISDIAHRYGMMKETNQVRSFIVDAYNSSQEWP